MGYAYDWGYLESFSINNQMFFRAPQEYFGLAFVVFIEVITKIINAIPDGLILLIFLTITVSAIIFFSFIYWLRQTKKWPRIYLRLSNWKWRNRGKVTMTFVNIVATPAYLISTIPIMMLAGLAYLFLIILLPAQIGFSAGKENAEELKRNWHPDKCTVANLTDGCTQIIESGNPIAAGILIAASDKLIALFDGSSVQIYTLNNRDIKTSIHN